MTTVSQSNKLDIGASMLGRVAVIDEGCLVAGDEPRRARRQGASKSHTISTARRMGFCRRRRSMADYGQISILWRQVFFATSRSVMVEKRWCRMSLMYSVFEILNFDFFLHGVHQAQTGMSTGHLEFHGFLTGSAL